MVQIGEKIVEIWNNIEFLSIHKSRFETLNARVSACLRSTHITFLLFTSTTNQHNDSHRWQHRSHLFRFHDLVVQEKMERMKIEEFSNLEPGERPPREEFNVERASIRRG